MLLYMAFNCTKLVQHVGNKIQERIYTLLMEKAMAPYSSTLAWKISWTEETGGPQSMGSLRVRHD